MDPDRDQYTQAETARRRDEVIRRMANTPTAKSHGSSSFKKEKQSWSGSWDS